MNIYIVNLLLALVWSGYYVSTKYAVPELGVIPVGLCAYIVALSLMGFVLLKNRLFLLIPRYVKKFPLILLVGFISFLLNILFLFGLFHSGAINASILMRFDVLFTLLIGYLLFRNGLSVRDYFGIGCMFISIILIMFYKFQIYSLNVVGDISFLLSAFCLAVNAFLIKHKLKEVPDVIVAVCNITMVAGGFCIYGLLFDRMNSFSLILHRIDLFISIVLAGMCVASIFLLYYYCLERLEVWVVRTLLLSVPGFTVLLAYLFLQESISLIQGLGFGGMFLGYIMLIRKDNAD